MLRKITIATVPIVILILMFACRKTTAIDPATVDSGDEKVAAASVAESDKHYAEREDAAKARLAVALLRQARTADYGSYEASWKLARADYYLGSHTADDNAAEDLFREGIESGKVAVQLQGNRTEGHFWLGANYGGSAQRSTLASLSNVEDIRREMEAVIKLDEKFEGGSAYMALGQLYLQAPRVLGGDTTKALDYFSKGLRVGPNNSTLRLHMAEALHAAGRDAEARREIQALMTITPNPDYLPEHKEAVEKAKKLLEKIDH